MRFIYYYIIYPFWINAFYAPYLYIKAFIRGWWLVISASAKHFPLPWYRQIKPVLMATFYYTRRWFNS